MMTSSITSTTTDDIVVSIFGALSGEFSKIINPFFSRGHDVFSATETKKVPPTLKFHDYNLQATCQRIQTWRKIEQREQSGGGGNSNTTDRKNRDRRFHLLQYHCANHAGTNVSRRWVNQHFFSDVIVVLVDARLDHTDTNNLVDFIQVLNSADTISSLNSSTSNTYRKKKNVVLMFESGCEQSQKTLFEEMVRGACGTDNNNSEKKMNIELSIVSIYSASSDEETGNPLLNELNRIADERIEDNRNNECNRPTKNNNNDDDDTIVTTTNGAEGNDTEDESPISFFRAQYFGMSQMPSFRNSNRRFALVRTSPRHCSFIEKDSTIISSYVTNLGTTFIIEDFAPLFGADADEFDDASSSSNTNNKFVVLVLKEADSIVDNNNNAGIPFFYETVLDPDRKTLEQNSVAIDGHGNKYPPRSFLTPVIFSDLCKDQSPLLPPRLLFVGFDRDDCAIKDCLKVNAELYCHGFGGTSHVKCLDCVKSEKSHTILCVFLCLHSIRKKDPLLLPKKRNSNNNNNKNSASRFNLIFTVSTSDKEDGGISSASGTVAHYLRYGDFTSELLDRVLSPSFTAGSTKETSMKSFLGFLEDVLKMYHDDEDNENATTTASSSRFWTKTWSLKNFLIPNIPKVGDAKFTAADVTECCVGVQRECVRKHFHQFLLQEIFTDTTAMFIFSHRDQILQKLAADDDAVNRNKTIQQRGKKEKEVNVLYRECTKTALINPLDRSVVLRTFISLVGCISSQDKIGESWIAEISHHVFKPLTLREHIFSSNQAQRNLEASYFPEPMRSLIREEKYSFGCGLIILFGHCIYRGKTFTAANIGPLIQNQRRNMIGVLLSRNLRDTNPPEEITLSSMMLHCGRGNPVIPVLGKESGSEHFKSATFYRAKVLAYLYRNDRSAGDFSTVPTIVSPARLFHRLLVSSSQYHHHEFQHGATLHDKIEILEFGKVWPLFKSSWTYWIGRFRAFLSSSVGIAKTLHIADLALEYVLWLYVLNTSRTAAEGNSEKYKVLLLDHFLWHRVLEYLAVPNTTVKR